MFPFANSCTENNRLVGFCGCARSSGDNHLITQAHGSLRRGETLGEIRQIRRPEGMMRLSLVVEQRPWPRRAGIITPWRTTGKKRERRRMGASARSVNPGADAFCNGPGNSGGRIRTCDLRVMSPTSCHCSTQLWRTRLRRLGGAVKPSAERCSNAARIGFKRSFS
jgi:hypothetical protein